MNNIIELFPTPIMDIPIPNSIDLDTGFLLSQEMEKDHLDDNMLYTTGEISVNTYILDEPENNQIKNFILEKLKEYGKDILGYNYNKFKITQSWISCKQPRQSHDIHSHPNSVISGVFYFGETDTNTPDITFHKSQTSSFPFLRPKEIDTKYNNTEFKLGLNNLILFPSYLKHSVSLNNSNLPRYSIAFNSIPLGIFGDKDELTELKL
tara:strand:- start:253 stop:876 length:624 start_codon:yes stop_codon:yes gene_type:complete